jgi:hypothetical protein
LKLLILVNDSFQADDRYAAVDVVVDLYDRRQGTAAQTGNALEIETAVHSGLPRTHVKLPGDRFGQNLSPPHMAGGTETDLDGVPAWRHEPELRVERGHSEHLVFGNSETLCNPSDSGLGQVTILLLNFLKKWDQIAAFSMNLAQRIGYCLLSHRKFLRVGPERGCYST